MMRYLALLLFAFSLEGQPVVTYGPYVTEIGHSFAVVYWETDVATANRLEYGLTTGYGQVASGQGTFSTQTRKGYLLGGLKPATTYHYRACGYTGATFNEGVTGSCSGDHTVTTLPEPSPHPQVPEAPDESWSNPGSPYHPNGIDSVPTAPNSTEWNLTPGGAGRVLTFNTACMTLGGATMTQVLTALATFAPTPATDTLELRLPTGANCQGKFTFPNRPNHPGWVVVRHSDYSKIPPEGVRMTPDWDHNLPRFTNDDLPGGTNGVFTFIPATCGEGSLYWASGAVGNFPLFRCDSGGGTQAVKAINAYSAGVFTVPNHGYLSGQVIDIAGTGLSGGIDGNEFEIVVTGSNTFTLVGWTPSGTWGGAGTATRKGTWRRISYLGFASGPTLPATCAEGAFFWKYSGAPPPVTVQQTQLWMCDAANNWNNYIVRGISTADDMTTILFAANAKKYRFVGIKLTRLPGLTTYQSYMGTNVHVNRIGTYIIQSHTNSDLVWDRIFADGLGYPARTISTFTYFDGTRVALINSHAQYFNHWMDSPQPGNWESYNILVSSGPGPGRIVNNYLDATGINVFWQGSDGSTVAALPADYVLRRNYITHSRTTRKGDALSNGKYYFNRHHYENKRGKRIQIKGNRFFYSWTGTNQGAFVAITPTSGPAPTLTITSSNNSVITTSAILNADWLSGIANRLYVKITGTSGGVHNGFYKVASASGNQVTLENGPSGTSTGGSVLVVGGSAEISDLDFTHNTFAHGPFGVLMFGFHNFSTAQYPVYNTKRVRIHNNLFYDLNSRSESNGGWATRNAPVTNTMSYLFSTAHGGPEDLIITNNTLDGQLSPGQNVGLFTDSTAYTAAPSESLTMQNNLITASTPGWLAAASTTNNSTMLNTLYKIVGFPAEKAWNYNNNVFCCSLSSALAGNTNATAVGDLKFFSQSRRQYRQRYDAAAVSRAGVDHDQLEAEQGKVSNPRVRRISGTSTIVSYYAPDAKACTVEYGTPATWGTGTRVSDGGGHRNRSVTLNGLTQETEYNYRVLCAVEQPSGVFKTSNAP